MFNIIIILIIKNINSRRVAFQYNLSKVELLCHDRYSVLFGIGGFEQELAEF